MALIKSGSINDFAVAAKKTALKKNKVLDRVTTFNDLTAVSRGVDPNSFELITSSDPRGVGLKKLKLEEGFGGFLGNLFNKTNNIYFIAWAWDLSGEPVNLYPGKGEDVKNVLVPMKSGNLREFIGQGIQLFPKRKVKGGIAIRIQIWESDEEVRKFGKVMEDTADAIKKSELNNLLSLISLGTGVSGATITLVKNAAIELAKVIGTILQSNGDDYVDYFEGYYASDQSWNTGSENYNGNSTVLTLEKY